MEEYPSNKGLENYPAVKNSDSPNYQHTAPIKYDPPTISQKYSMKHQGSRGTYFQMVTLGSSSSFNQEYKRLNLYEIFRDPVPKPLKRCINCSSSLDSY